MQCSAHRFLTTTALATVLTTQAAFADIAPNDVWTAWQGFMTRFGYEVSAIERADGANLTIEDLTLVIPAPETGGDVIVEMGNFSLEDLGDGTVGVVYPDETPIVMSLNEAGEDVKIAMSLRIDALDQVISGTPEAMVATYSAALLDLTVDSILVDGEDIPGLDIAASFAGLNGIAEILTDDDVTTILQSGGIETLSMRAMGLDPESGDPFAFETSVTALEVDARTTLPDGDFSEDPRGLFAGGFELEGSYGLQAAEATANFVDDDAPGTLQLSSGPGTVTQNIDADALAYTGALQDVSLQLVGGELPVPVDAAFGEISYGLDLPLAAAEEEQPFAVNLKLSDLTLSELIWGMFDPGQILPRDPASLVLDVTGLGTIFTDLMSLDDTLTDMPAELNALTLQALQFNAAGASVSGSGDFVFDNTDYETFEGFPRPEGEINVTIEGINSLMDNLVKMGLLPENQAMAARMAMSAFARPGDADDSLVSKIEVNDNGHVLANGQRIR